MTFKNTMIEHKVPAEVIAWLEEETQEQEERYQKIVAEMKALNPSRDRWYEEFFERLRTYGFNTDGDQRTVIADEDLPVKPDRDHSVVY